MKAFTKRDWSSSEDDTLRQMYAAGKTYHQIALALGVSRSTASSRGYALGLRRDEAPAPAPHRWNCGHCAIRSDAPLDFGCAKCLPLRRMAA